MISLDSDAFWVLNMWKKLLKKYKYAQTMHNNHIRLHCIVKIPSWRWISWLRRWGNATSQTAVFATSTPLGKRVSLSTLLDVSGIRLPRMCDSSAIGWNRTSYTTQISDGFLYNNNSLRKTHICHYYLTGAHIGLARGYPFNRLSFDGGQLWYRCCVQT